MIGIQSLLRFLVFGFILISGFKSPGQNLWYKVNLPGGKSFFIDTFGKVCPIGSFDNQTIGKGFKEGLLCVNLKKEPLGDDRWGCLNEKGDTIIKGKYLRAFEFEKGVAKVITGIIPTTVSNEGEAPDYYCQYINLRGDTIIGKSFEFNESTLFEKNWAAVKSGRQWYLLSKFGRLRTISRDYLQVHRFNDGIALCNRINGYSEYIDTMANPVLEIPNQNLVGSFVNGYTIYSSVDGKFGFMNRKAQPISPCIYDSVRPFYNHLAAVKIYNHWGFIDTKGKMVIKAVYEKAEDFNGTLALVKSDSLYGYINRSGQIVIPAQYKNANGFTDGLAAVCDDKHQWGYIDINGHSYIKPQFYFAENFDQYGFARVYFKNQNSGKKSQKKTETALISKRGKIVWKSGGDLKLETN